MKPEKNRKIRNYTYQEGFVLWLGENFIYSNGYWNCKHNEFEKSSLRKIHEAWEKVFLT